MKEFLIKRVINSNGEIIDTGFFKGWGLFIFFVNLIAFILMVVGIGLVIAYSRNIPWWIWLLLGVSLLFLFIGNIIASFGAKLIIPSIFWIMAFLLLIAGIIFFVIHSKAPWWIYLLVAATFIFAIISIVLDVMSQKDITVTEAKIVKTEECGTPGILPTANIPEQVVPPPQPQIVQEVVTVPTKKKVTRVVQPAPQVIEEEVIVPQQQVVSRVVQPQQQVLTPIVNQPLVNQIVPQQQIAVPSSTRLI